MAHPTLRTSLNRSSNLPSAFPGSRRSRRSSLRAAKPRRQARSVSGSAKVAELHSLGLDLFLHQQGIDTTTPAGKAMFQMMGVFAEFERSMIQERVKAGIARARAQGKRMGRPSIDPGLEQRIRAALQATGRPGFHKLAAQFGVATGTIQRIAGAPSVCLAVT